MKHIKLWKNGQLKELEETMFEDRQAFIDAVWFWEAEGWSEEYPNDDRDTVQRPE